MLGSDIEMPGMAEESSEIRGEQPNQLPASAMIAVLAGVEQRIDPGPVVDAEPANSPFQDFAMPLEQLDARQPKRQAPCPVKLFIRQHRGSQIQAGACSLDRYARRNGNFVLVFCDSRSDDRCSAESLFDSAALNLPCGRTHLSKPQTLKGRSALRGSPHKRERAFWNLTEV
jgi:hypothetical protein